MPLPAGSKFGPYEVVAPLGAGGMGEVYRARDPRLGRDVALKVLPGDVSQSSERRGRFEREARSVAALNHQPANAPSEDLQRDHILRCCVSVLIHGACVSCRQWSPRSGAFSRRRWA